MSLNINVFPLKIITCLQKLFYSLLSKVKCEYAPLNELKKSYAFFAEVIQEYSKFEIQTFLEATKGGILYIKDHLKLESICLVNGNDQKIIKKWKDSKIENFIPLYNKEIENAINTNLTKDGDKVQIIIKINEKIPEFVFWEFIVSGECVKFSNCHFSKQKVCSLDYFPQELHSIDYLLYYRTFWFFMLHFPMKKYEAKNIMEEGNIKSSIIKTSSQASLFYNTKNIMKPSGLKFTDFNLLIKQTENFKEAINNSEMVASYKYITLFFEATKKIPKINFDVFISVMDPKGEKQRLSAKIYLEISNDEKVTCKIDVHHSIFMEIQEEETYLKVILCRPTVDTKNSIKNEDSMSIEFMDLSRNIKSSKIILAAVEKIEDDFTFTTFTIKKDENKYKNLDLYNAMTKYGLVTITLNGKIGIIGTYVFGVNESGQKFYIYSDKLVNIPFGEPKNFSEKKSKFYTKKNVVFIVCILIFMGIFGYFYTKKK